MKQLFITGIAGCMFCTWSSLLIAASSSTAGASSDVVPASDDLAHHDFFYAGESHDRKMFIVRGGKVAWSYDDPTGTGEISDAVLLANSNVLFAHQFAVTLISSDKKTLWNYDAPKSSEIHTALPIGNDKVLYLLNGPDHLLRVVNIATGQMIREFPLPVKNPQSAHGQFRHARLTAAGTLLVAHMDLGMLAEYDSSGKQLWSAPMPGIWGVTPLSNGNSLVTDNKGVHELDRDKKVIWEILRNDLASYHLASFQQAWRLQNGNTLLNDWVNEWNGKIDRSTGPPQAVEVTPDKKVVWMIRAWNPPVDLGPATTIQMLDDPDAIELRPFGDIK